MNRGDIRPEHWARIRLGDPNLAVMFSSIEGFDASYWMGDHTVRSYVCWLVEWDPASEELLPLYPFDPGMPGVTLACYGYHRNSAIWAETPAGWRWIGPTGVE